MIRSIGPMMAAIILAFWLSHPVFAIAQQPFPLSLRVGVRDHAATWFPALPSGRASPPLGWVYLQHGYPRHQANMYSLAISLARQGLATLTIQLDYSKMRFPRNRTYSRDIAVAISDQLPKLINDLPPKSIMIGHSLGGVMASVITEQRLFHNASPPKGLILLDPVDEGKELRPVLQRVHAFLPVFSVLAERHSCNTHLEALPAILNIPALFLGVKLSGGSHCDGETWTSDTSCAAACGRSLQRNRSTLTQLVIRWSQAMLADMAPGPWQELFPGGQSFNEMQAKGYFTQIDVSTLRQFPEVLVQE